MAQPAPLQVKTNQHLYTHTHTRIREYVMVGANLPPPPEVNRVKFDATETKLCQTFAKLPPLGVTGARDISPASPFYSLTLMLPTVEGNTTVAR